MMYQNPNDERPINATGYYNIDVAPFEEIEIEEHLDGNELAPVDNSMLESVK